MNGIVYLFAVLKNVIYGLSVFFTGTLSETVDVLDVLALRFLLSTAVLWLLKVTKLVKMKVGVRDLFKKKEDRNPYLKNLLIAAIFEPVLYMFFETLGISMTTGITAGVILSLAPITGCIAEEVFLKEKTTLLQKVFLAIGIVGVIYISVNTNTTDGKDSLWGILFVVIAVLVGSLFLTFSRKSSKAFSAMEITYISSWLGMVVFNAVNVVRHLANGTILTYFAPYMSIENMVGFVFLAVISTVIATGMNNFALGKMQVSTMSAFGGLSTLVTIAVGVLFNNETLYPFHIIGMILILIRMVGVSWIQIRKTNKSALS